MDPLKRLDRSVKGRAVLVTGAASGMGRATAHLFAIEGALVAITDIDEAGVARVVEEIAARAEPRTDGASTYPMRPRSSASLPTSPHISAGSTFSSTTPVSAASLRLTATITTASGTAPSPVC